MNLDLKKYDILHNLDADLRKTRGKGSRHRFLGRSEDGLVTAVINLAYKGRKGTVELVPTSELNRDMAAGVVRVVDVTYQPRLDTPSTKKFLDKAWSDLEPLWRREDIYFDKHLRAKVIEEAALKAKTCPVRIRYLWRRYLQGGCNYDGLRCDFAGCGKPEDGERIISPKAGRPSPLKKFKGRLGGRFIDEEVKERFLRGIKDHVVGINNRNVKMPESFQRTLDGEFRVKKIVDGVETLEYEDLLPNYDQFRYFVRNTLTRGAIKKSRKTSASHGTSDRSKLSESRTLVPKGPNDIFLIDSTEADIYIVADEVGQEGRKLVGRPRLYLIRDAFSRMIVGWHLTLGDASYQEAVCALINVLEDKKAMCEELGVPYDPAEWPLTSLAGTIIADRQELVTANSDLFLKRLSIHITCPPGYRGDLKGLIEAGLGQTNAITWRLPGGVDPHAGKDERDYRQNAMFSFKHLKAIILEEIIKINRTYQSEMPVPKEAANRGIEKIPVVLHAWGVKEISGLGLSAPINEVKRKLLPLVKTASSRQGGVFISAAGVHGMYYRCEDGALPKGIFEKSGLRKLIAQYDPRSMTVIWVEHPVTREMVPCRLSQLKHPEYLDLSWAEGAEYEFFCNAQKSGSKDKNLNKIGASNDRLRARTAQARAEVLAKGPVTRSSITDGQKIAREKQHRRDLARRGKVSVPQAANVDNDW